MVSNKITPMELQSIDTSTIAIGAYSELNYTEGALSFIRFTNASNTDIFISYDGTTDHFYVRSGEVLPVYYQANSVPTNKVSKLKKHTMIYARGVTGVGYLYVAGYYSE